MTTPPSSSVDAPLPGRTFGRFVLMAEAGRGAMGTVYAAYDPSLDRRVALKVLRSSTGGHQRERIRREALAMARVSHPNVARVYEVGQDDGRLFIAMEFIDGVTLAEWQATARPWREVARLYAEVAGGLAAAHAAGLVHRDFKPDNVLIDPDGRPRIIDFGLARSAALSEPEPPADGQPPSGALVDSGGPLDDQLTRTGHVMGTPAYMAPELMAHAAPTPRSDQFAFSVAFYEGLCGQPPFPRDSLVGLRVAVTRGEVQPAPPDRDVPGPLMQVVARGLAPAPDDRFPSMDALIRALDRHVADDELADWRPRLAIFLLVGVVLLLAVVNRRTYEPPESAADLLWSELWIGGLIVLCMAPFHRTLRASQVNRRAALWILLITPAKVMMPAIGLVYGVGPEVVHAFDTVLVAVMTGVAALLITLSIWPAFVISVAALVGLLLYPPWVFPLHDLAMMALPVTMVLRAVLTARKVGARSWIRGARVTDLRSRPGPGPGGTG